MSHYIFERVRCNSCGKFMNHGYVYTPWGSYYDSEPPEDKFVCSDCYTPGYVKLLSQMWHPATPIDFREEKK